MATYPNQVFKTGRPKLVFGIDAHFGQNEENPLAIFSGWSRYVMTIIDKKGAETKTPFCNIPISDFEIIRDKVKHICLSRLLGGFENANVVQASEETDEFAQLVDVKAPYKYPTLRDAIIKNGGYDGIDGLISMYSKGYERFPANRVAVDNLKKVKAMDKDTVTKKLSEAPASAEQTQGNRIPIYEVAYRPLLSKKTAENGDNFCYAVSISYNPAMTQKFVIKISNFYAPVTKNESGMMNVAINKKHGLVETKVTLTDEEMLAAINAMDRAKTAYESTVFSKCLELCEKENAKLRAANS